MLKINYIGHSAFFICTESNKGVLIDPFIKGNPKSKFSFDDKVISEIFVTHGHADHLGDAISISQNTQSCIYTVFELANYCASKGAYASGMNIGGGLDFDWGWAKFLPAFHSNSTPEGGYAGMPASILLNVGGVKIYHAGDTSLNSEMKVIGEVYRPDIALLPVGSCYTMDLNDAVIAAKWLGVKKVVPMHYNTFDAINVDTAVLYDAFNKDGIDIVILNPGETLAI